MDEYIKKRIILTKKRLIIVGVIIIIIALLFFVTHESAPKDNLTASKYTLLNKSDVVMVKHGVVDNVIAFTGDLSPLNQTIIASEVDAEVLQVKVAEGEFVHANQVLAILDDTDLKEAVRRQRALLAAKKAIFTLDQKKLDRQKDLFTQGFISKFAYDELQTNYQSSLEAINQEEAAYKQAQKQLSYTIVRAPFAGYIYQKSTDNGQLASKNGKLFALASLDVLQIKAAIPSEQINKIQLGQSVLFRVEASNQEYMGKITRLNPVAETGTRSYMVYIDFDNTKYKLKAGQFVKGQIVLSELSNVDFVQTDAIRDSNSGKFVFTLEQNKIVYKPVQVLLNNNQLNVSAITGLKPGDTVLSGNIISIKPGDLAKIIN